MRTNVKIFCKICSEIFDPPEPIYEFGSFCYPDQKELADMRPFFKGKKYVGCDVREGHNVDRVENLEQIDLKDASVGTAIVLETMEHVEDIQKAFRELYRVLKPGGMLIVASPFIFPIHDLPNDYWRFTPKALAFLMKDFTVKLVGTHADPIMPHTVYGIGFKGVAKDKISAKADKFVEEFETAVKRKKKFSYDFSLFIKGLIKGKAYVESVRKRHMVTFKYL